MSTFATISSSERMDWPTPRDYFAALHAEFAFTVDAAASAENACLPRYWSEVDEGLMQSWSGERVYMNPPYGRQLPYWIRKAWNEQGHAELIVALIPARTDTSYWHDYIFGHAEIRFLRGRLRFEGATNFAPFPVAVVIWHPPLALRLDGARPGDVASEPCLEKSPGVVMSDPRHDTEGNASMQSESTPDYQQLYETMVAMNASVLRVAQGLCPKCGAEREDNDCRACGHWSLYVKPFLSRSGEVLPIS